MNYLHQAVQKYMTEESGKKLKLKPKIFMWDLDLSRVLLKSKEKIATLTKYFQIINLSYFSILSLRFKENQLRDPELIFIGESLKLFHCDQFNIDLLDSLLELDINPNEQKLHQLTLSLEISKKSLELQVNAKQIIQE